MTVAKMQTLVNAAKAMGWPNDTAADLMLSADRYAVMVPPSHEVTSAKPGLPPLEEALIPANAGVLLRPLRPLAIYHFTAIVSVNPALIEAGTVSCPAILTTGEGADFVVGFRPYRAFDIKSLPWLVRLSFIN